MHDTNGSFASMEEIDFSQAERHAVVIVGTGPAGFTAAVYAARANLKPVVFRGPEPGGQLVTTTDVENYPGFPDGIMGPEMMEKFEAQAVRFGADVRYGMVTQVDLSERPFKLLVDDETPVTADAVIVSTGASAVYLGLPNEKRLLGRGVSACATCDGAFFRDVEVAVVGGGDTAMEEAMFLTRFASRVYVIHRRDELRASQIMQDRAMANPKITFLWSTAVKDVIGEQQVEGLRLLDLKTNEERDLPRRGSLRRDRASAQYGRVQGLAEDGRRRLYRDGSWFDANEYRRRVRMRRRTGQHLPAGHHGGGHGVHGLD